MKAGGSSKRSADNADDDASTPKKPRGEGEDGGSPPEEPKPAAKAKAKKTPDEKDLEAALKAGKDIKTRLQKAATGYDPLCKSVEAGTDWNWADEDVEIGVAKPLKKAHQILENKHTQFSRRFLLEDERQLKKDYKCVKLTKELNTMVTSFKDALA